MNDSLPAKDRETIRTLAKRQAEIAALPIMRERAKLWTGHNSLTIDHPMIFFETNSITDKSFIPDLVCESETGRKIESQIKWALINHEKVGDDRVVTAEFLCPWIYGMTVFDMPVKKQYSDDGVGFHIEAQLGDLSEDLEKVKPSSLYFDYERSVFRADYVRDILGDILTVRMSSNLCASLTNELVHRMSMEGMFISMLETPEAFHRLMDILTGGYLQMFDELEKRNMLTPNNNNDWVCQGTFGFTNELPVPVSETVTTKDLWGYADSQETVGISPALFGECIFPYYKKIIERYGLAVYGCCEPVHPFWDGYLGTLDNIRKVSISPWCDEQYMGERLRGSSVIYQRKPSPNYVGVGAYLDEDAFRKHIRATIEAAKGCALEITFRDVYTLNGHNDKPKRAVEIVREELAARR